MSQDDQILAAVLLILLCIFSAGLAIGVLLRELQLWRRRKAEKFIPRQIFVPRDLER